MTRYKIKDLNGRVTHMAEFNEVDGEAWLAKGIADNWFGAPEDYVIERQDMTPELEKAARKKQIQRDRRGWIKEFKNDKEISDENMEVIVETLIKELFQDPEDYENI